MARSDLLKQEFYQQEVPVSGFLPSRESMVKFGDLPSHVELPLSVMLLGSFDPGIKSVVRGYHEGAPRIAEKLDAHFNGVHEPHYALAPLEQMLVLARVLEAMGHCVVEGNFTNRHIMNLDEQVRQLLYATDVRIVLLRNSGGTLIEVGQLVEWSRLSAPTHFGGWQKFSDRNGRPFGESGLYLAGRGRELTSYLRLGHGLQSWMNISIYDPDDISDLVTLAKRWILQQQYHVAVARTKNPAKLPPNPLFRGQERVDTTRASAPATRNVGESSELGTSSTGEGARSTLQAYEDGLG